MVLIPLMSGDAFRQAGEIEQGSRPYAVTDEEWRALSATICS
jgi:hypothetical protein